MSTNAYADEGTAAHTLAERCLKDGSDAGDHVGEKITIQHYKHAKLGASSAHRWLVCPGSVLAQPEDDTPIGPGTTWDVTDEMAEAVQVYLDVVRQTLKDLPGSKLYIEQSFELFDIHPEMAGSCDSVVLQPFGKMRAFDYKHGMKAVEVEDNPQMKFYGVGAVRIAAAIEEAELTIVQPRAFHKHGPVRNWTTTPESIVAWGQTHLKLKAAEAFGPHPAFVAGDHCKYCRYTACATRIGKVADTAMTVFSKYDTVKSPALMRPADLTNEQMGRVLEFADGLSDWIKAVEEEAYSRAMRGETPLGFKLVQGKAGHRKWKDEAATAKALPNREILYEESMRSPAQVEAKLKAIKIKLDISQLVIQSKGSPTLVPITDARPTLAAVAFTPVSSSFLD